MPRALRRWLVAVLLLTQLSACALSRRRRPSKKAAPQSPPAPQLVGTVTLVNEEQHFVLIDSTTSPSPLPNAVLRTRGAAGETAELKAGAIRRRPFAIADVVKGAPKVGDQVFQQPP